jgi:hypothetical protein
MIENGLFALLSNDSKYIAKRTVGIFRRLADSSPSRDPSGGAIFGADWPVACQDTYPERALLASTNSVKLGL